MTATHVPLTASLASLATLLLGCAEEPKDPFLFCEEDRAPQMLRPSGDLTVQFFEQDVESPHLPFRTYIEPFDDGSVHLAACQLDEFGNPWHLRTRWHGVPDELAERTDGSVRPADQTPLLVEGFLNACPDPDCNKKNNLLHLYPGQPAAIWLDQYSKSSGRIAGGIVLAMSVGNWEQRSLLQVYLDLNWEPRP